MNELTIFNFSENEIRVVTGENGEPWFVAADVCRVLDIKNPTQAMNRLDDDKKQVIDFSALYSNEGVINQQLNSGQKISIINESGLYSLVLTSRKLEAKAFKKWITSEVLPSVRKSGGYQLKPMTQLEFAKAQVVLLERLEEIERQRDIALQTKAEIGSRREATAMATASAATRKANALEIELDRSRDYCTIKRMQMIYHGMEFNWRALKQASIEMGVLAVDVFDQNYGKVKAYHRDVWREAYALEF